MKSTRGRAPSVAVPSAVASVTWLIRTGLLRTWPGTGPRPSFQEGRGAALRPRPSRYRGNRHEAVTEAGKSRDPACRSRHGSPGRLLQDRLQAAVDLVAAQVSDRGTRSLREPGAQRGVRRDAAHRTGQLLGAARRHEQ